MAEESKQYISKIKLSSEGTTYHIMDAEARKMMEDFNNNAEEFVNSIVGGLKFIGVTSNDLTSTTTGTGGVLAIRSSVSDLGVEPVEGNIVIDKNGLEYIAANNGKNSEGNTQLSWNKIGYNTFGDLAFRNVSDLQISYPSFSVKHGNSSAIILPKLELVRRSSSSTAVTSVSAITNGSVKIPTYSISSTTATPNISLVAYSGSSVAGKSGANLINATVSGGGEASGGMLIIDNVVLTGSASFTYNNITKGNDTSVQLSGDTVDVIVADSITPVYRMPNTTPKSGGSGTIIDIDNFSESSIELIGDTFGQNPSELKYANMAKLNVIVDSASKLGDVSIKKS